MRGENLKQFDTEVQEMKEVRKMRKLKFDYSTF